MSKKLHILAVVIASSILVPTVVFAADGQLVSGPSGTLVNGWYSTRPTLRVDTLPGCPSGPSGNIDMLIYNEEGQHHITLRSHLNGYPRIYRDDDTHGHETTNEVFSCPAVSTPYTGADPVVFWQGDIKWDATAPTISLSAPSNNSNTESSSVTVTGIANDGTSGVWTVMVNGVSASLSGANFSANVPVSLGLNTLTAIVKDYAGNTSQAQVVVNRIAPAGDSNTTSNTSQAPAAQSAVDKKSDIVAAKPEQKGTDTNQDKGGVIAQIPTPVKAATGVGAAGLGIASVMGYIPYKKIGLFVAKFFAK